MELGQAADVDVGEAEVVVAELALALLRRSSGWRGGRSERRRRPSARRMRQTLCRFRRGRKCRSAKVRSSRAKRVARRTVQTTARSSSVAFQGNLRGRAEWSRQSCGPRRRHLRMVSVLTPKRRATTPVGSCERAISARTAGVVRAQGWTEHAILCATGRAHPIRTGWPTGWERALQSVRPGCPSSPAPAAHRSRLRGVTAPSAERGALVPSLSVLAPGGSPQRPQPATELRLDPDARVQRVQRPDALMSVVQGGSASPFAVQAMSEARRLGQEAGTSESIQL